MFRKIVSNLAFSPALVGQLGFYAKRLRKEEATRRIGLIFTVLALIVQSFAVLSPPESANAASSQDLVYGGAQTVGDFLGHYDRNENNLRDIYTAAGVTRDEIINTQSSSFNSKNVRYSIGRNSRFSAAQGEVAFQYARSNGGNGVVYISPNRLWDTLPYTVANGSTYSALVGHSAKLGWFAIMKNCGNLAMQVIPPPPPPAVCPIGTIGTPPNCMIPPQPAAVCSALTVTPLSRTEVTLRSQANVANGARISGYNYAIKNSAGKQVFSKTNASAELADSTTATLKDAGNYIATVSVNTSLGVRTSDNCTRAFTIAAPDKCILNPELTSEDENCKPCPGNPTVWVKDKTCVAQILESKTASNLTQKADAVTTTAQASDRIAYTVSMKNIGLLGSSVAPSEQLSDVLEYAKVVDNAGGTFDETTKTLSWPEMALKSGQEEKRTFVVELASTIPSTARGASNPSSYDCIISNTFGNVVAINVNCAGPKQVEQIVGELPHTGAGTNMIFAGVVFAGVAYFYTRSRQLKTEVRLIRRDLNSGSI